MSNYLFLVSVKVDTVSGLDSCIVGLMGGTQISGHLFGVVKIGQCRIGMVSPGIENGLRGLLDAAALLRSH